MNVLMSAVGGEPVTTTIEGRERYSVNVRYLRDYRSDIDALQTSAGQHALRARRFR